MKLVLIKLIEKMNNDDPFLNNLIRIVSSYIEKKKG